MFRTIIPTVLIAGILSYFKSTGCFEQLWGFSVMRYLLVVTGLIIRWKALLQLGDAFKVKITPKHSLMTSSIYINSSSSLYRFPDVLLGIGVGYAKLGLFIDTNRGAIFSRSKKNKT